MSDPEESGLQVRSQVGKIRGLLEIISIATEGESLRAWLADREDLNPEVIGPGYIVFLETGLRQFVNLCDLSPAIEFEHDYVTERAIRQLADLSAVPHSTEKLNFCRAVEEIQKQLRSIDQSSSMSDVFSKVRTFLSPLLELRKTMQDKTVPVDLSLDSSEFNKDITSLTLYKYFQNTRKNRPSGYEPSNFDSWLGGGPRENAIIGYTATLQFVWSQLLSPKKYVEASIDELTTCDRWTSPCLYAPAGEMNNKSGTALSDYRTQVKEAVVDPIASKYAEYARESRIDPDDLVEIKDKTGTKTQITELFSKKPTRTPSELDPHDRVRYGLIWSRRAEWISSESYSKYWMVETVLRGLVQLYSTFEEEVPIHISRFNHPDDKGGSVTYAILQRVPQSPFGDPSVWLVFDRLAVESEIRSQYRLSKVENLIDALSDINPIKRIEVSIERSKFIKYVSHILSDDYLILHQAARNLHSAISAGRGIVTELATVYVLSHREKEGRIYWSTRKYGSEIDVLVCGDDYVRVIECKASISSTRIEEIVDQLVEKVESVDVDERDLRVEVWAWEEPSQEEISTLRDYGIEVTCIRETDEIIEASTKEITEIFEEYYPEGRMMNPWLPPSRDFS